MKGDHYASLGEYPKRNWPSRAHGGTLAPNPGGADFPDGVLDADEVYVKQTYTGVNGEVIPVVQTDRGVYAYPGNAIPQVTISGKEALAALRAEDARAALADFNSDVQAHNDQMAADWGQSEGGWADSRQPDRIPLTNEPLAKLSEPAMTS
ncbi:hypothetical protein F2P45_33390 [Massilia sp. CCM 8733]|uniref:Uncharacterized protein n=1 Tax=Massilia mucilaginosa TaxID=2609282 RepID=A0ABX0P454_9BURK|nr:hypothetical protein [Massilia mucilaginosa]NHZ93857.1 hypothetical protein [Massilia mucilaginosa]